MGQPFMPWQRDVAMVGGEIDPVTGFPAYRQVIVTVPRQSGKTTLFLAWQIHRCLAPRWNHPQRSVFTAQSGKDARDKWLDELYPLISASPFAGQVATQHTGGLAMNRGMGNEHILWSNDSIIRLLSTSSASGHSKTIHQAVLDEIWHDGDNRREQALRPAMITVDDAQLLVCSTAGTPASVVLQRKVRSGRAAVERDTGRGIAYFEYSAPEDFDPFDEDGYFGFMPALCPDPPCRCGADDGGWRHTVTLDTIRGERDDLDPPDFARAYANIEAPLRADDRPIPVPRWAALAAPRKRMPPRTDPVFFVHVSPESETAAIAAAYPVRGRPYVALVDYRPGTSWLVTRCRALVKRHPGATWVVEAAGAVGAELPALYQHADVDPEEFTVRDMGQACLHMQQLVRDRGLAQSGDAAVAIALGGAGRRMVGEGLWVFSARSSSVDVTPAVAVAGALWGLESLDTSQDFAVVI